MSTRISIYRMVNFISGKCYVGQTGNYNRRKTNHINMLRAKRHHSKKLQSDYDSFGEDVFYFEIVQFDLTKQEADEAEVFWISCFNSITNGYNTAVGGKASGCCPLPTECEWNGVKYESILVAAEANHLSEPAMRRRIVEMRYKTDADIRRGPGKMKSCTWNGIEYNSITTASKALGINASSLSERIQKGYKSDSDLHFTPVPRRCEWNGIQYPTIKAAAKDVGLSTGTMRYRIDQGYTCDADMVVCMRSTISHIKQFSN